MSVFFHSRPVLSCLVCCAQLKFSRVEHLSFLSLPVIVMHHSGCVQAMRVPTWCGCVRFWHGLDACFCSVSLFVCLRPDVYSQHLSLTGFGFYMTLGGNIHVAYVSASKYLYLLCARVLRSFVFVLCSMWFHVYIVTMCFSALSIRSMSSVIGCVLYSCLYVST